MCTRGHSCSGAAGYRFPGSWLEERDLVDDFVERYIENRKVVALFLSALH
jgi:hypothetical protein